MQFIWKNRFSEYIAEELITTTNILMFFWILNAILGSISGIFWKKSLNLSTLPHGLFFWIGAIGSVMIAGAILIMGKFEIPKELWILAIPLVDAMVVTYNSKLSQRIYTQEKISSLLPYENFASVITIVIAFFLFRDTPLPTFIIALAIIAIIFVFSFDFKKHEFPRNFKLIILNNIINGGRSIAIGYALAHMTSPSFYTIRNLLTTIIVWTGIVWAGQLGLLRETKSNFLIPRLMSSFLGAASALIGFTLISKFGLITSTLLGFLSMISTLILGYFFLADHPEKKNIMLAITVAILVGLWTFFKS